MIKHNDECGCPQCVREAQTKTTDQLLSKASDYPHGRNCNCGGCTILTQRNAWDN